MLRSSLRYVIFVLDNLQMKQTSSKSQHHKQQKPAKYDRSTAPLK
jgi:hypothetical protein